MNRMQGGLVALTVASALALSAGCSSSSGNSTAKSNVNFGAAAKGTLNAWGFNNPDDVGTARMNFAKAALKGVNIKMDETNFDAQKFTTRVAGGNVPDVVQMDNEFVATYAAQGLIMPLNKCYSANKVDPNQRFYKALVDAVSYKNQIWAVPQFLQPNAIIVNKTVMNAAGVTNADIDTSKPATLLAAIKKMYKSSGGLPTTLGFDAIPTGQASQWVVGLGGQLSDSTGKPTLNDPKNAYPLDLLKEITDAQGGWAKVKSFSDGFDTFGAKNQFVKNQVGAQVDAQWYPNVLSPYKDKIDIQAVPFLNKSGKPVSAADGQSWVIPAKAKNPAAACAWALQLTSEQNWLTAAKARAATLQKNNGLNTGLFTGSPAADVKIRQEYVKSSGNADFDQVINTFYQVVPDSVSIGSSPVGQQIQAALVNAVTATLLGQSAQKALDSAQQVAMNAWNQTKH